MEDLDNAIAAGAVGCDPEDCIKVAKMYESAGTDLILMLVQVGAIPHEKVMQTIDLDREARDAEIQERFGSGRRSLALREKSAIRERGHARRFDQAAAAGESPARGRRSNRR